MTTRDQVYDAERAHVSGFIGGNPEDFTWTLGPIGDRIPDFRVLRYAPSNRAEPWAYATVGAWEATPDDAHGLEFVLLSPTESAQHVELLAMVTNFHADPRYRLSVGRTINIGRPWLPRSEADHLLVSLPYPYGPEFETCVVGERHIRYLWLVPITGAEARLVHERGLETLEQRLESRGVDIVDPRRRSVA